MTSPLWTPADELALDTFVKARRATIVTSAIVSELDPMTAVFESFAALLRRCSATAESGTDTLRFSKVLTSRPPGWDPQDLPSAYFTQISTKQWDSNTRVPWTERDKVRGKYDIFSADGRWALWAVGEDVGEASVTVTAPYEPIANTLAQVVREALFGDIDNRGGVVLPLPQAFLPASVRGLCQPVARLSMLPGGGRADDAGDAAEALFRVVVRFAWQAPRIAVRSALPTDIKFTATVT